MTKFDFAKTAKQGLIAAVTGIALSAAVATASQAASLWGSFVLDEFKGTEASETAKGHIKVDIFETAKEDGRHTYTFKVESVSKDSEPALSVSQFGFSLNDAAAIQALNGAELVADQDNDFGGFGRPQYRVQAADEATAIEFSIDTEKALDLTELNGGDYFFAALANVQGEGFKEQETWVGGGVGVPLPAAAWLFGSALVAFGALGGRRVVHSS